MTGAPKNVGGKVSVGAPGAMGRGAWRPNVSTRSYITIAAATPTFTQKFVGILIV